MKKNISFFFILLMLNCFGQFRQRINAFFMDEASYKALPSQYNPFVKEMRKYADDIFFQSLQFSSGKGGDFKSLDIIFKRNFDFLNTGFIIEGTNTDKMMGASLSIIPIISTDTWKAKDIVDFSKYNPLDNTTNFFYYKYYLNLTDEQLLANFINNNSWDTKNSDETGLQRFVKDINKVNKINIGQNLSDATTLKEICKEINQQMPKSDCGYAAYKTYLLDKDEVKTRNNINNFYRNLNNSTLENITDNFLLPKGIITFEQKELKLTLPKSDFKSEDKNSEISFFINEIEHQLTYDFEKKTYILIVNVTPYNQTLSNNFSFVSEYYDVLKGKKVTGEIPVEKTSLKKMEFLIYPEKMEVRTYFKNKNGYNVNYMLKKTFNLKNLSK